MLTGCTVEQGLPSMVWQDWGTALLLCCSQALFCRAAHYFHWQMIQFWTLDSNCVISIISYSITSCIWALARMTLFQNAFNAARRSPRDCRSLVTFSVTIPTGCCCVSEKKNTEIKHFLQLHSTPAFRLSQPEQTGSTAQLCKLGMTKSGGSTTAWQ